jgi:predicted DNA-binding transcriptional regulator YafY
LKNGVRLRVAEIAEHFGCSSKTAQRDIALLKEEGIAEDVGPTRNRYYVLAKDVGQ